MSRDFSKICKSINDNNQRMNGEYIILQEIESIKNDIKAISKKLDKLNELVVRLINGTEF